MPHHFCRWAISAIPEPRLVTLHLQAGTHFRLNHLDCRRGMAGCPLAP